MNSLSDKMKQSMDIMARERGMGIAFAVQFILSLFLYFVMSSVYTGEVPDYMQPLLSDDFYPLFSFSILLVAGAVSIFIMTLTGSITDTYSRKKRRKMGSHLSRAVYRTPYAVVAFLFPWIFTFGISFLFFLMFREPFNEVCIFTAIYYFIIWIVLAKTFFTPYFIVRGKSIGDALKESWKVSSSKTIELSIITGVLSIFAYLSFLLTFAPDTEFYTAIIFLIAYSLIMVYMYVLIGYMAFSGTDSPVIQNVPAAGYMPVSPPTPTVLLAGFTPEEVYEIRKKGVPATSMAEWARNASLYDVSNRPSVYEGDSTWYPKKVAIFSGVAESDRSMLIYRIQKAVSSNIIFTSLTPLNSGYTLDSFLMNFVGAVSSDSSPKEEKKEEDVKDAKENEA